jgi:hypothetical protein
MLRCSKSPLIDERPNQKQILIINNANNTISANYSLIQNVFDPTKSSPPNEFMLKLQQRMNVYGNSAVVSGMGR